MKEANFGDYLRKTRKSKKLTIIELAERSGLSYSGISRIEKNERGTPKPSTIKLLAQGLDEPYELLMEKAGYVNGEEYEGEYDYTSDPTVTPELKELLDDIQSLSPEDRALIIQRARTFVEGIKALKHK
ncbi:helix-turn-helix domain-containing protein [Brevibacillus formosus]|uniref:helix-turn-helix domain-containing protein n=1 Tax=Brevibacillus formosus TaxID=54913 RepID=UPI001C666720|nr:helix-turn-helix transcriptional regulator [Brevibacillus formosus]MBW5471583.1 helix-turn-helix domain-containing protein [Brevibacillus formosus]